VLKKDADDDISIESDAEFGDDDAGNPTINPTMRASNISIDLKCSLCDYIELLSFLYTILFPSNLCTFLLCAQFLDLLNIQILDSQVPDVLPVVHKCGLKSALRVVQKRILDFHCVVVKGILKLYHAGAYQSCSTIYVILTIEGAGFSLIILDPSTVCFHSHQWVAELTPP
jgi:hypothetical protein